MSYAIRSDMTYADGKRDVTYWCGPDHWYPNMWQGAGSSKIATWPTKVAAVRAYRNAFGRNPGARSLNNRYSVVEYTS